MYRVRECSNFILLHVAVQVSPAPLIKEAPFYPLCILASFVKDKVSIGVWIYLWAFYFVPSDLNTCHCQTNRLLFQETKKLEECP